MAYNLAGKCRSPGRAISRPLRFVPEPQATDMPEDQTNLPETQTLHDLEAERARRSQDPVQIKQIYHSYGRRLQNAFAGREEEVVQHGSQKVAEWQARHLSELESSGPVLDVGCGPRPEVSLRLARPNRTIVCTDISHEIVNLARAVARQEEIPGLRFVVSDAEVLPFASRSFAQVVADDVIEHLPHPECMVSECARVSAPDGVVCISTPNRRAVSVLLDRVSDVLRGASVLRKSTSSLPAICASTRAPSSAASAGITSSGSTSLPSAGKAATGPSGSHPSSQRGNRCESSAATGSFSGEGRSDGNRPRSPRPAGLRAQD